MGVVIEMCIKHPGGPTRIKGADIERADERQQGAWLNIGD
jgi:hypothetical protein